MEVTFYGLLFPSRGEAESPVALTSRFGIRGSSSAARLSPLRPRWGAGAGAPERVPAPGRSTLLQAAARGRCRGQRARPRVNSSAQRSGGEMQLGAGGRARPPPPTGAWQSPQTRAADLLLMRHGRGGHRSGISVCRGCSLGGWAHSSPGCLGRERWGQRAVCGQLVPDPGGLSPLQDLAGHREDRRARVTWGHAALPGSDRPHGTGSRGDGAGQGHDPTYFCICPGTSLPGRGGLCTWPSAGRTRPGRCSRRSRRPAACGAGWSSRGRRRTGAARASSCTPCRGRTPPPRSSLGRNRGGGSASGRGTVPRHRAGAHLGLPPGPTGAAPRERCLQQHLDLLSAAKEQVVGCGAELSANTYPSQRAGPQISTS